MSLCIPTLFKNLRARDSLRPLALDNNNCKYFCLTERITVTFLLFSPPNLQHPKWQPPQPQLQQ